MPVKNPQVHPQVHVNELVGVAVGSVLVSSLVCYVCGRRLITPTVNPKWGCFALRALSLVTCATSYFFSTIVFMLEKFYTAKLAILQEVHKLLPFAGSAASPAKEPVQPDAITGCSSSLAKEPAQPDAITGSSSSGVDIHETFGNSETRQRIRVSGAGHAGANGVYSWSGHDKKFYRDGNREFRFYFNPKGDGYWYLRNGAPNVYMYYNKNGDISEFPLDGWTCENSKPPAPTVTLE